MQSVANSKCVVKAAVVLPVLLGLLMAGCVTSSNSRLKVDKAKALEAHVEAGLAYLRHNNRDAARHHLTKALEIDDDSAAAHNGLALLYQMDGEPERAEKHFRRAIREDKRFSQAQFNYGAFLYAHNRYQEAFEAFQIAADDLGYDRRPSALANLGRAALKLGNKERAQSAFEHALSLDKKLPIALVELAELNFEQKNYAEAKKLLKRFDAVSRQTPRTLWLGIRIERIFGNKDKEASYALALKNLHPYSKEYLEYKKLLKEN